MCGEFIQIGHQHACPPVQRVKPAVADIITAPSHYIVGGYECREVIAALGLCFDIGAAFKYIWRAGRKDGADEVTDLRKAVECIEHRIRLLTGAGR
jgi:ubiquinone biosynthesis protein UbiJ